MIKVLTLVSCLIFLWSCGPSAMIDINPNIESYIESSKPQYHYEGEMLHVDFTLKNKQKKDSLSCEYKMVFVDNNGMEVQEAMGGWKPIMLDSSETKTIKAAATVPNAKSCKISVRKSTSIK